MSLPILLPLLKVCQPYIPNVHSTKSQSLDTAQMKEMELQEPQDKEQAEETIDERNEIQEITSLEFFNSKIRSSNMKKGTKKHAHHHLWAVAHLLKMRSVCIENKLYYYLFVFTIY